MATAMDPSMPQPYPALPASPTLTNPDMILPDYDHASSLDLDDDRSQSPLMMWKQAHAHAHAASSGPDRQPLYPVAPSSQHAFIAGPMAPMTPTTPIIYGNGTMLSDIGEVTEVESTPGKPSPSRRRPSPHQAGGPNKARDSLPDVPLASSPTTGLESVKKRARQQASQERLRRASMDSTSTITTQDQAGLFADFDDTASVGDSVFQGDDEESVADSYAGDSPVRNPHGPSSSSSRLAVPTEVNDGSSGAGTGGTGSGNVSGTDDRQSTAALSRRAEQILANAKRRLTTMEGNLSRARSSLYIGSPTSISSHPSDGSTPSPPIQLRSSAILREARESSPGFSPGHARMGSDNALRIGLPVNVYPPRSASALGAAGGYRQPTSAPSGPEQARDQLASGSSKPITNLASPLRDPVLEPLSEDEILASPDARGENRTSAQLETFLSPTFGGFAAEKGLTRSASAAQMRDLKDQMKDLKGKISSLREQARADSLKRRSLQSLRTPSPFTHARVDQWYAEPEQPSEQTTGSTGKSSSGRNPWNGELESIDGDNAEAGKEATNDQAVEPTDEESILSGYEDPDTGATGLHHPSQQQHFTESPILGGGASATVVAAAAAPVEDEVDDDDMHTENGDAEEDDEQEEQEEQEVVEEELMLDEAAYESESGESSYHDTLQHPLSHEDREDAFDYEHFILHSALGTISQQRLAGRGSRGSFSSEGSVETTRGPVAEDRDAAGSEKAAPTSSRRNRRGSGGSTSTVESFATATEGRASRTNRSSSGSDEVVPDFPPQTISIPAGPESPLTARRAFFSPGIGGGSFKRNSAEEPRQTQQPPVARRPASSAATMLHRPSISSFESTGTMRSFPLVNRKAALATGVLTPSSSSPDEELKNISETLLSETASICEQASTTTNNEVAASQSHYHPGSSLRHSSGSDDGGRSMSSLSKTENRPAAMQTLLKDDQFLVERLVAGLGRCVLGLSESGRASAESRMYRRRIDAARRILEGLDVAGRDP